VALQPKSGTVLLIFQVSRSHTNTHTYTHTHTHTHTHGRASLVEWISRRCLTSCRFPGDILSKFSTHFLSPPIYALTVSSPSVLIMPYQLCKLGNFTSCNYLKPISRIKISLWRVCYLHNTQQTPETNISTLSRIRTLNPSNQAAADLRLSPHSYRCRIVDIWTDG
jgi:hypothetical protein